jgi:hypothetical protein
VSLIAAGFCWSPPPPQAFYKSSRVEWVPVGVVGANL